MAQPKLVLFIASTLDGYIAAKDHDLSWLFQVEGEGDNGISEFYQTIGTILMGRTTYRWIMDHEKEFPYKDKNCYVFSASQKGKIENIRFVNEDVVSFTRVLKRKAEKNIWLMGGSELIHSFIREKLVDEIIVTIAPVLLGSGIPLFKPNDTKTLLRLKEMKRFGQFAALYYDVIQ